MKPWENGALRVSDNKRYLKNGDVPFFWLGDTAWLLMQKCSREEAYTYLKNRKDKGYTVIQAVLVHSVPETEDSSSLAKVKKDVFSPEYWKHCDEVISMAEELGLYMALLPAWGALVKNHVLTAENVKEYADFLGKRYQERPNIVWLLGGDVRGNEGPDVFDTEGWVLKSWNPDRLIGYHPFGRTSSSLWFHDKEWLDFDMFQSGHRRYDQVTLGQWDDNAAREGFFGEDNWRYVERDLNCSPAKPTVDGEPSYEGIPQGLHDSTQPYWQAHDVRRYAYWSVFAGAMGHTYGSNAVMQFYDDPSEPGSYGVREVWQEAIHHSGAGQMKYLKELMESVDYQQGRPRQELLVSDQGEKYNRISVFGGKDYLFVYDYSGRPFDIELWPLEGRRIQAYWLNPADGIYSFAEAFQAGGVKHCTPPHRYEDGNDWVLVFKADVQS